MIGSLSKQFTVSKGNGRASANAPKRAETRPFRGRVSIEGRGIF